MRKNTIISVIIPTKNEEKNILRCLKSIKQQKFEGILEVILVDNNSKDRTVELAKKHVDKIIIAGPERSAQRNTGAKAAHGEWLLFLDADMELSKDTIEECHRLTKNRIVTPIVTITEQSIGTTFWGKALALEHNCYKYTFWLQAARFFPKKHFLNLGGYDEDLIAGEDWDITERFRNEGLPNLYTKYSYLTHHEPDVSLFNLLKKEMFYIKHINKYAKKHPLSFSYQGSLLYRFFLWTRHWRELLRQPILTMAFLSYKLLVWTMWQWHRRKFETRNLTIEKS
jgi:glycosyltransferase involved in cell wall biosynthesis